MASINRIRATWTGSPITGPAASTFYWANGVAGSTTALRAFFLALASVIPTTVTIQVQAAGDVLNDANGSLAGVWTDTTVSSVTGTDGTGPIDGVGARVRWLTGGIFGGRRVVGSTFIVPIGRGGMSANGQPDGTTQATIQAAASALVAASAGNLLVYSRDSLRNPVGESNPVVAAVASSEVSWLRSRRT